MLSQELGAHRTKDLLVCEGRCADGDAPLNSSGKALSTSNVGEKNQAGRTISSSLLVAVIQVSHRTQKRRVRSRRPPTPRKAGERPASTAFGQDLPEPPIVVGAQPVSFPEKLQSSGLTLSDSMDWDRSLIISRGVLKTTGAGAVSVFRRPAQHGKLAWWQVQ